MDFQPGQVLVMKSGGPRMTVVEVNGTDVRCIWMEADGKRQEKREDTFPAAALQVYTPQPMTRRTVMAPRY